MIVRERLTGLQGRRSSGARAGRPVAPVDRGAHRPRPRQARLDSIEDQKAFAQSIHKLLAALDMGEEAGSDQDDEDDEGKDEPDERVRERRGARGRRRALRRRPCRARRPEASSEDMDDSAMDSAEAPSGEIADEADYSDAEQAADARRAPAQGRNEPRGPDYRAYSRNNDEIIAAEELCDPEELERLRAFLDKQLSEPLLDRRPARQPAAAPADGAAEPLVGVRPRGGHARSLAAAAYHHRPEPAALVQAREGHGFPRYRRDAAARQFRLDARAADHGGGDLRRHPRAHAGALRRQGRDPGLHHPGLEGRHRARGVAAGRQAGLARPAQRPAPHHLQVSRRALAPRAKKPRADDARGAAEGEHRRRGARLGAQAPARPPRAAAHSDDDLGWRAGRRFDACR